MTGFFSNWTSSKFKPIEVLRRESHRNSCQKDDVSVQRFDSIPCIETTRKANQCCLHNSIRFAHRVFDNSIHRIQSFCQHHVGVDSPWRCGVDFYRSWYKRNHQDHDYAQIVTKHAHQTTPVASSDFCSLYSQSTI